MLTPLALVVALVVPANTPPDSVRADRDIRLAACLTTAMRNWRFERGPFVVETIVFPFRFSPSTPDGRRIASGA